ncbi:MAG: hypothetical protein KKC28_10055, partial [Verrucomicrobia bacterium]|nr:hypothetical protein [Verrucomicrobiota bacterium]
MNSKLVKSNEAPRGKPRGNLLCRSSTGYAGRVFAEPCEAKNAIPSCGLPQGFLAKKGKFCALLGAFLLLTFIPRVAFAQATFTNVYILDVATNYPGSDYPGGIDYLTRHALIQNNARWGIGIGLTTNITGQNVPTDGPDYYVINFLTMTNYYVPTSTSLYLTADSWNTNLYWPYSNTLSVTIAGPTSPVLWSVAGPSEWINSSAYQASSYTNNYDLTPIPTGQYTVTFPAVAGWTAPAPVTTNITGASPLTNSITGTYVLSTTSSTLTVQFKPTTVPSDVRPTARWWVDSTAFGLQGPYSNNYVKTLAVSNDYTVSY